MPNPSEDRFAGGLSDLELDGALCLLLHDDGSCCDPLTVGDIADTKLYEIAAAQFAVDGQIEQREFALAITQLEPDSNGPDIAQFKR